MAWGIFLSAAMASRATLRNVTFGRLNVGTFRENEGTFGSLLAGESRNRELGSHMRSCMSRTKILDRQRLY